MSARMQTDWTAERVARLLKKAKRSPTGWKACCPAHDDSEPSLFMADADDGIAMRCYAGCTYREISDALKSKGCELFPSRDQREIPDSHFQLGEYHSHWDYHDPAGSIVMRVCRWEQPGGKKDIRPLVRSTDGWKWQHHPAPRPLFQLDRLVNDADLPAIVVEGEKTAVAAQKLFPTHIATTWPGGAAATGQADWGPLAGREVVLFPDCDVPGRKAMQWVRNQLEKTAKSIRVVDPVEFDSALPEGWDLADAFHEKRDVSKWLEKKNDDPESEVVGARNPMRWRELEQQKPPDRIWRLAHWLSVGPTLFAGRGGTGKSLVAQTLATAFVIAQNYLDEVSEPIKVLAWFCEDDHDELWRRQVAICDYFSIKLSDLEGKLVIEPRLGCENTLFAPVYGTPQWTPLKDELREQMNDYGADLLIADNTSHLYGCNENSRHEVTKFVNGLCGLVTQRPVSQLIMSHPAKSGDSEFSGSTAWENSVRMRWFMGATLPDQPEPEEDQQDPNVRYIAKRKTNYSVMDYRKLIFDLGVFKPENAPGDVSHRYNYALRREGAEVAVLSAVTKFTAQSIRVVDARNSPDSLVAKMRAAKLMQDYSPKEIGDAIAALRLAGRLIEAPVGTNANRTAKVGLKVSSFIAQSERSK
jgi:RecA-family ATPase